MKKNIERSEKNERFIIKNKPLCRLYTETNVYRKVEKKWKTVYKYVPNKNIKKKKSTCESKRNMKQVYAYV